MILIISILLLLVMISGMKLNAFIALIISALFVGITKGMPFLDIINALQQGIGSTLGSLILILAFGVILGNLIFKSGKAQRVSLWLQMVADIFQMKVVAQETIEGAAWGAVIIGFKAIGISYSFENKTGATFYPNPNHKEVYEEAFDKFKKVYPLLRDV